MLLIDIFNVKKHDVWFWLRQDLDNGVSIDDKKVKRGTHAKIFLPIRTGFDVARVDRLHTNSAGCRPH